MQSIHQNKRKAEKLAAIQEKKAKYVNDYAQVSPLTISTNTYVDD